MTLTRSKPFTQKRPSEHIVERVESLSPYNPFATKAYLDCLHEQGREAWIIGEEDDGELTWGCYGVLDVGRLVRRLEIPSLDTSRASDGFWDELFRMCRAQRVSELVIGSYGVDRCVIPARRSETARTPRTEYVLDLADDRNLEKALSSNHRRNIKRAARRGIVFAVSSDIEACRQHAALQGASMERRSARGESVPQTFSTRMSEAATRSGLGKIYQALLDGRVVSSMLILHARDGAYYHTAGTSREGMESGASQALVHEISRILQRESISRFCLGGAGEENPGLVRFKLGFGAKPVALDSAAFFLGNPLRKRVISTLRKLLR